MQINIVITGVGGQGTLLASRILGALAAANGLDVKVSEVHGMAQRGGNVVTYVRIGDKVHSPLVEAGQADVVLAFEQLEALRALPYLKTGGIIVTNEQKMLPMPVIMGAAQYPEDILGALRERCRLVSLDALGLAGQAGSQRAVNIVLMGAMARGMEFDKQSWLDAIAACVPPKTLEVNMKAFELGWQSAG
ncbi:MAG: indolepyruvate oxidoreductase subunit beta [Candidatus Fimadaptatus sp.]|jgi:indolepyruvate ferredoxin oxidoreductase beta subunit